MTCTGARGGRQPASIRAARRMSQADQKPRGRGPAAPDGPPQGRGSNLNYPESVPFGSSSDLNRSFILSKLSSVPSDLVMWSRPALSRNASLFLSLVTPSVSCRSADSTACASDHLSQTLTAAAHDFPVH